MFEKETKFLYDFSMNQIKQLGSYITFDELAALNLHPAILRYISAEIDYLIYEDRQRLLSSSNFDYSGEEINKYFVLMTKEIKRTKKFSLDYVGNIILHAISFSLNYLAQPNWSLVKLIFAKESYLKSAEVVQILKYVYFYTYIPGIIEKYIQKKSLLDVQKAEIEALLSKADREIFSNSNPKLIDGVLCSMGEFVNIGNFNKTKIPLLMFELYLKEKKLDEYWNKLESGLGTDIKLVYDITELQRVIYSPSVSPQVKKENYLEKLINQEKPLGIFRNKKETQEEEPFQPDENIVQMIQENSRPETEQEDAAEYKSEENIKEEENVKEEDKTKESPEHSQESEKNDSGTLLVESFDEKGTSEEIPEELELEIDSEDDIIFLDEEIEKPVPEQELPEPEQPFDNDFQNELEEYFSTNEDKSPDIESNNDSNVIQDENEIPEDLALEDIPSIEGPDNSGVSDKDIVVRYLEELGSELELPDGVDFQSNKSKVKKKDLAEYFTQREIHKVINTVFNDDMKSFARTFDKLAECDNMTQAEAILNSVFVDNFVSPGSKGVKIIRKNLQNYFNQV